MSINETNVTFSTLPASLDFNARNELEAVFSLKFFKTKILLVESFLKNF